MTKKAILYIRVSTDEQADKGYSLGYQEERLKKYCEINSLEILAIFNDDHSAKTFDRPAFKKMMEFAKKNKANIDFLLFIKWDRFSRNTRDSYHMIHEFFKLNIEVCAIEQHLDLNIPEAKLMLAFYLAAPEVENDRRALNVFSGMRKARKEGRWIASAPLGYKNIRDERNKPIIVPDNNAPFIREAFEALASKNYTIEDVRRRLNENGLKCSRSNFNRLVQNPIYAGKIFIPAYKEEHETYVQGIHEPIIDEGLFWTVQHIISGRKPKNTTKSTQKKELPLRGFLKCSKCGCVLTGSASKGKFGTRYFYYHCREGCPERIPAEKANNEMAKLLEGIAAKGEVIDFYGDILLEAFKENDKDKDKQLKRIQEEIDKNVERINKATQMMLDAQMEHNEYKGIKSHYEKINITLLREKANLELIDPNFAKDVKRSLSLLKNIDQYYIQAEVDVKQKIVSSIFTEKLIFENNQYRTPKTNEVISWIMQDANELEAKKKGLNRKNSIQSLMVVSAGIEPASKV